MKRDFLRVERDGLAVQRLGRGPTEFRIAVASLMFETNSFAPGTTSVEDFQLAIFAEGPEVLTIGGGLDSMAGAIAVARRLGVQIVPTTAAGAVSGPIVAAGVYAELRARLLRGLAPLRGQVDGVYLQLHGAMACEDEPDVEGDLLRAVVEMLGVPVAASLDLHCHFTDRMAQASQLLAGFHTLPHVDMVSTGERAMRMLVARLHGADTAMAWCQIPMITSAEGQDTNMSPMREVMSRLAEIMAEPGVLDASVFMTQPWLDVPGLGWTTTVISDGNPELARLRCEELAQMVWSHRGEMAAQKVSVSSAMEKVLRGRTDGRPLVLSDGADSVSAGAPGDGTELLAALADASLPGLTQIIITDANAAARCKEAGIGAEVQFELGAGIAPEFHKPAHVAGIVTTITDGRFRSLYPPRDVNLGSAVVVRIGEHLHVVVTEEPACQLDYQLYLRVGLDPRDAQVVVTKSAGGYRAFYEPFAGECIDVETKGPSDSRIERLPFRRITRPLFPFDEIADWVPQAQVRRT